MVAARAVLRARWLVDAREWGERADDFAGECAGGVRPTFLSTVVASVTYCRYDRPATFQYDIAERWWVEAAKTRCERDWAGHD